MFRTINCSTAMLALCLTAGACAAPAADHGRSRLAGTTWQLRAIQSMDDAQGTTTVSNPERFAVAFMADGQARFRLDCNGGTGRWEARQAAGSDSGSLSFTPIAATRMLCPAPSLGERVVRDLAYVRSYLIKDRRLYMSLLADGGILEWERSGD